ncbi:unnamed protein product [Urochloa humidicola]
MGLQNRGNLVEIDKNINPQDVPDKYKYRYNDDGIHMGDLKEIMYKGPIDEDFDRSFVLYLMGTILAPVCRIRIPICYYSVVRDVSQITNLNWNEFTLRFIREDIANLKAGLYPNRWPHGNLAILQYIYWEKVRPWGSNFSYFGREPPLVKYWDEVTATKRDIYEMSYGCPSRMVVDDLKIKPSIDNIRSDILQNHMSTPASMVASSSVQFAEITNRLSSIDKNLVRCLEGEFNINDGPSTSNDRPRRHQNEDDRKSVADRVTERKRRRNN